MDRAFSAAVAALFFMHTACGCCWHRAHESAACNSCLCDQAVGVCQHVQCASDGRASDGAESSDAPGGCEFECQGVCTFLPPQKPRIDAPRSLAGFDLLTAASASFEARGGSWRGAAAELRFEQVGPPPRLNLLHRIWLI